MLNIVLCGGSGERLWPLSRTLMPKQFVKLFEGSSLYQECLKRNETVCDSFLVVSNEQQYFLSLDQFQELSFQTRVDFLLEPCGKNTAPAIALACFGLPLEQIVLVTPSDHLIEDVLEYQKRLEEAKMLAEKDNLVTFGIRPTSPHTGYGYIEAEGEDVKAFYEKPDSQTAQQYLKEGNYYWNSGMFCFKVSVFLDELKKYAPEIYNASKNAYERSIVAENSTRISFEDMKNIPSDSIDYAIMEKSKKVKVVYSDIGWDDLGSFDALEKYLPKDDANNTVMADMYTLNANNNFVYSEDQAVALADVQDLIIVATSDAILVSRKGVSQKVKEIVAKIKQNGSMLYHKHKTVHKPWGYYTVLQENPQFKIKTIVVHPHKRLSLQKHFHRSEHWVVVSGEAIVEIDERKFNLNAGESTYIQKEQVHRLSNCGTDDLTVIEVQVGEYLSEDDIVRLEDDFQRA